MGNKASRITKKISNLGNRALRVVKKRTNARCYLYMLPPELRRCIFIQAAKDSFEVPGPNSDIHYPDPYYDLGKLLDASIETVDGLLKGLTPLEMALLRGHKKLYFESFDARLSLSALFLSPIHDFCPQRVDRNGSAYPIFGKDLPYCLVESVRNVVYERPLPGCDHDKYVLLADRLTCLYWHELSFEALQASLKSLAIGLKINDPAMERRFHLEIGNVWFYIAYIEDKISRGSGPSIHSSESIEQIFLSRKQLALQQNKLLDDLCKELFGLRHEPAKSSCYLRIYNK